MTLTRRAITELLDRHGVVPSRALGQNFVADPNTVRRVARLAAVGPGDRVVEVGAGVGCLTLALAETGAEVVAVEIDRRLVPALREVVEPVGVRVVEGDAMTLDWDATLVPPSASAGDEGGAPGAGPGGAAPGRRAPDGWVLVANLPYNVATPLILDLLARVPLIERMLVMVQAEVAERLSAGPGTKAYGIPSVKLAWWARARVVGHVPASVFLPRPRVSSALLAIERRDEPRCASAAGVGSAEHGADRAATFALVDAGFAQRRKMLRRALEGAVPAEAFERAGVEPTARAEELGVERWAALAAAAALPRDPEAALRPGVVAEPD